MIQGQHVAQASKPLPVATVVGLDLGRCCSLTHSQSTLAPQSWNRQEEILPAGRPTESLGGAGGGRGHGEQLGRGPELSSALQFHVQTDFLFATERGVPVTYTQRTPTLWQAPRNASP